MTYHAVAALPSDHVERAAAPRWRPRPTTADDGVVPDEPDRAWLDGTATGEVRP